MNRARVVLAAAGLFALLASGARAETIALTGATLHPVSGPEVRNGTILMRDGRIVELGARIAIPADARRVDLSGRHVYPSIFPAVTVLGLAEIGSVRATLDTTELGEINPQARADFAMNFDSELLPVARSGGVLVAGVSPSGGLVSGSLAVMRLEGWTREDAAIRAPAAILVTWPSLAIDRSPTARFSIRIQEKRRDEAVDRLKDVFAEARAYAKARGAEGQPGIPRHDVDPRLEALVPALEGRIPVVIAAHDVLQIRSALTWTAEVKLRCVLLGAEDGWRVADEIARADVPVLLESLNLPRRPDEPYDTIYANAGVLARAGVRVGFDDGASDSTNVRNIVHQAAAAVAYGFPREKALSALTLEPAKMLGVADRIGSLEPGKSATLIVTDGDILDLRSHVVGAYLDGRSLDLSDRQKRLYERYRARPKASP